METNDLDGFMAQMRGALRSHKQESTTSVPADCHDARVRQSTKASAGGDDVVDDLRRGRRLTFAVPSKPYSGLTTVGRSQVEENQQMTASIFGTGITQPTLQIQSRFQLGIASASTHAISQLRALPQTPLQNLPESCVQSQPQLPSSGVSVSGHAMGQLRGLPQNSLQSLPQSPFQDTFQYSTFSSNGLNSAYSANSGAFGVGTFGFHGSGAVYGSPYVPDSQINDEPLEGRLAHRFRSPDLPYPNTYGGPLEVVPIPTALLMKKKPSLSISQSMHPTETVMFHPDRQRMLEEDCEQDIDDDEYGGEYMSQQRYHKKHSGINSNLTPLGSRAKIPTVAGPSRLHPPSDPPSYLIEVFGGSSTSHRATSAAQAVNAIPPPSRDNHEKYYTTPAPTLPGSDLDSGCTNAKTGIIIHHSDNASIHDIADKQLNDSDLAGARQNRRIRVGNLHRKTTKEDMITLFRGHQVETIFFPSDRLYRGILKYCLVDLVTSAEAEHALIQLKEIQLHERYISVRMPHQLDMNNESLSVDQNCRRQSPPAHGGLGTNSATDMSAPALSCTASLEPLKEGGDEPLYNVGDSLNTSSGGSYSGPEQAGQEETMEASSAPFFACCSAMEAPSQELYPGTFTIIKNCCEENVGTMQLMSKLEIVGLEFFPALRGPYSLKRAEQRDIAKILVKNEHGEVVDDGWWTNVGLGKHESSGWHKLQVWDGTIFHERFIRADFHFCCKVHRRCFDVISLEKADFFVQSKGETVLKKQKKSTLRHNGIGRGRLVDPPKVNRVAKKMMAMKQQHDQRLSKMDSRKGQMIARELVKVAGQGQVKVEEQTQNNQATCEGPMMEKIQESQEVMLMCVDPSTGGSQTIKPAKPLWMEIGDILEYAS